MAKEYVITADSTPDLDDWGWDDYWKIEDWMRWHSLMVKKFGIDKANQTFLLWWNKQTTGANPLDAKSFNTSFRTYAKKYKFLDALYGGASFLKPFGAITDTISSGSDVVSNVGDAAKNTSNVLKWAVPVAVLSVVIIAGVILYKKYS